MRGKKRNEGNKEGKSVTNEEGTETEDKKEIK